MKKNFITEYFAILAGLWLSVGTLFAAEQTERFFREPMTIRLEKIKDLGKKTGQTLSFSRTEIHGTAPAFTAQTNNMEEWLNQSLKSSAYIYKKVAEKEFIVLKKQNDKTLPTASQADLSGKVAGKVTGKNGETLPGATVKVMNQTLGTVTNANGNYELELPAGTYVFEVSFVGYSTKKVAIDILQDNILKLNIALEEESSVLGEVVITAPENLRYAPMNNSTEESLVSDIKTSDIVITGISNEQIAQTIVSDAAQIVKKVGGVSLFNNFVLVRGMSSRYNVTTLNGMVTPSTEADTRSFRFDLLPASVIDQIMVYKSPSPDLPGNFGGGVIEVTTKRSAKARRFRFGFSQKIRGGSTFKEFYAYKQNTHNDWYGGGVKPRQLPGILMDRYYEIPKDFDTYPKEISRAGNLLPSVRTPSRVPSNMDFSGFLHYYDSWKIGEVRINNLSYIDYSRSQQFVDRDSRFDAGIYMKNDKDEEFVFRPEKVYRDSVYKKKLKITALQNLNIAFNKDHNVSLNLLAIRNVLDLTQNREDYNSTFDQKFKIFSYRYDLADVFQGQIKGSHQFHSHLLEWSAGLNLGYNNTPDLQRYEFFYVSDTALWRPQFRYQTGDFNTRISMITRQKGYSYKLDYTKTFSNNIKIKTGVLIENINRNFFSRAYMINIVPTSNIDKSTLLSPKPWNNVIDTLFTNFNPDKKIYVSNDNSPGVYAIKDWTRAGYAKLTLPLFKNRLQISGGIRFERNKRNLSDENGHIVDSIVVAYVAGGKNKYEKLYKVQKIFLPSVNIRYNFTDNSILRLGYGKTIDKPEYREQGRINFFDFENNASFYGNPLLRNAKIDNYEIRFEHYPSASELLSVGVFYKKLTNAIERYENSNSSSKIPAVKTHNTTDKGTVYGVEVEARKNIGFITHALRDLNIILNATWLKSSVGNKNSDKRELQGSPPYILNAGFYYGSSKSKTKASIVYNLTGRRLFINKNTYLGALYMKSHQELDLTFSQQITRYLKIKTGVKNILDGQYTFFRDDNFNQKYDPGFENARILDKKNDNRRKGDYIEQEYKTGRYFYLGLAFNF